MGKRKQAGKPARKTVRYATGRVLVGSCLDRLRDLPDGSVDSIVTDPPYELGFMGKAWDASGIAYSVGLWEECLRVLKPGGHLLAFGGTRTYHRMVVAIEDAGFEIRDSIHWIYGSGFPKSLDVSKAIDKAAGAEREIVEERKLWGRDGNSATAGASNGGTQGGYNLKDDRTITAPATDAAKQWAGWGTALKPAHEPIVVARKPLDGTVAANVLAHGTGALNIDGCRVGRSEGDVSVDGYGNGGIGVGTVGENNGEGRNAEWVRSTEGRWPANVILDENAGVELDAQSGTSKAGKPRDDRGTGGIWNEGNGILCGPQYGDTGGASRFFYCPKPSRAERNAGLDDLKKADTPGVYAGRVDGSLDGHKTAARANYHPTVKPVALIGYLVRLVTPPGGVVLDPFLGSGTTAVAAIAEGFAWVGCELTPDYLPIIAGRVRHAQKKHSQLSLGV
jgi:DNA modification methylase